MARFTATEMVGVQLSTTQVQRLLDALAAGALGAVDDPDNLDLKQKLEVMLQVSAAGERRRAQPPPPQPASPVSRSRGRR